LSNGGIVAYITPQHGGKLFDSCNFYLLYGVVISLDRISFLVMKG